MDFAALYAHEERRMRMDSSKQGAHVERLRTRDAPTTRSTDLATLFATMKRDRTAQRARVEQVRASMSEQVEQVRAGTLVALTPTCVHESFGASTLRYCDEFLSPDEAAALHTAIRAEHAEREWLTLPRRKLLMLGGVPHPNGLLAEELPRWFQTRVLHRLRTMGIFAQSTTTTTTTTIDVVDGAAVVSRVRDGEDDSAHDDAALTVLINQYSEAEDGIAPHNDGPLFEPLVAIVSLVTPAALRFYEEPTSGSGDTHGSEMGCVLLNPGSLFVFGGEAYERLLHGIAGGDRDLIDSRLCLNFAAASVAAKYPLGEGEAEADSSSSSHVHSVPRGHRISLTVRCVRKVERAAGEYVSEAERLERLRRKTWWAKATSDEK